MSQLPVFQADPSTDDAMWEAHIRQVAAAFPYPPTPRLGGHVPTRAAKTATLRLRLVQAAAVILLLFSVSMGVPQVRAEVQRILQIGVIRILFGEEAPAITPSPVIKPTTTTFAETAPPRSTPRPTRTPPLEPTTLDSVLDLPGETTLAGAHERATFPIRLPTYPANLGEPDRVFYFETGGAAVALVWLDPQNPEQPILSLFEFSPGSDVWKTGMDHGEELMIDGIFALWTDDPHLSSFYIEGYGEVRRAVTQPILIWFEDPVTYRLEGELTQEEAIRIVQSIP